MFNRRKKFTMPDVQTDYISFREGLDTETPQWEVPQGRLKSSKNYEIGVRGGYCDIEGYESFDGSPKPSDATYAILDVTISGEFSLADTVTQLTSGATGVVIAVVTTETPNYLVLTKITGTFDATNDLQVAASTEGTATSLAIVGAGGTSKLNGQYKNLAADSYRADIAAVTGTGDVLGVIMLNDVDYVFRANAGNTATDLYKSTSSGFTQVPLGFELDFTSGGVTEIVVGDTITGATSTETAVLTGVALKSGTWAAGDVVGKFTYLTQSGPFVSENVTVGGVNLATVAANGTAITLSVGGRYEMVVNQFGGEASTQKIWGCDGVNRGFSFDGTTYIPIDTGMTTDTPLHTIVHKNHLFFSFGASAQHSGINSPYNWTAVSGAAELATGDTITNFVAEPSSQLGSSLGIHNRNTIHILYGSGSADWELTKYRGEVGSYPYTAQGMVQTIFQDDRGIANLRTVQDFGNFQHSTLSRDIQSAFDAKKTLAVASCIVRDKNQYRIFYSDKTAFYITMEGDEVMGIMPIIMDHVVTCMYSLEDSAGNEVIKFGSDDGRVYEMDKGTSFDGDNIDAFMFFHFAYSKFLRYLKNYLGVVFEASGNGYSEFGFSYELGYGDSEMPQPNSVDITAALSESRWDVFAWDSFIWDTQALSPKAEALYGSAENIALIITKNSDYFTPVRLSGATLRFIVRRLLRE